LYIKYYKKQPNGKGKNEDLTLSGIKSMIYLSMTKTNSRGRSFVALEIYTDGGCSGNPGKGGWAFIILQKTFQGKRVLAEKCGAERETTNNRMELMAAIAALETLKTLKNTPRKLILYTDSQYLQKGMTEWLKSWKDKGWRTSDKAPVKNQDLWRRLDAFSSEFSIKWTWVKGHAGNEFNEKCDRMTARAISSLG
jgi:ribonuclease HI